MIRKFATVSRFRVVLAVISLATILTGAATVCAQDTPAQQPPAQQPPAQQPPAQPQPDNQSSTSQEASPEEIPGRKVKPREYKNWSFNVGGGASLVSGTTKTFVRGGGGVAAAGVARNFGKYFGLRADFQFANLPLRNSALGLAQAPGGHAEVYSLMVGPVINIPVTKDWGGYLVFGPGYFHRSGKLDSSTAIPGAACNPFFTWWGSCLSNSLPVNGNFLSSSENQIGYDFGGGVTRKIRPSIEIYAEFRFVHGRHSGITTDFHPITLGVRW
jgi:opacity protein-like surface antigen